MPVAIDKPSKYFNTITYTASGNGQVVTGNPYKPDFVWLKRRSLTGAHYLYDVVRGANNSLQSNSTSSEASSDNYLTSFNSDGWTLGSGNYTSPDTIVGWNWLASNTTVSNTSGSITSTVSANTTSGFSIVSYTGNGTSGATVGHGLGVTPKTIFIKSRSSAVNWTSYHSTIGNTAGLHLNTTGGSDTNSGFFNNTSPTSTVFTLGDGSTVNTSSGTYIAYCFAEVKGYSKFSSYTGNGSADGTFVYTGFTPAMIIAKNSSSAVSWTINDNKRNTFNPNEKFLYPNLSDAEGTNLNIDYVSNGFKIRATSTLANTSGETYIYACFASNPFVSSKGVCVTAR